MTPMTQQAAGEMYVRLPEYRQTENKAPSQAGNWHKVVSLGRAHWTKRFKEVLAVKLACGPEACEFDGPHPRILHDRPGDLCPKCFPGAI